MIYKWSTQQRVDRKRLHSGDMATIKVTGLNALCYDYEIGLAQEYAVERIGDFLAALKATKDASPAPPAPGAEAFASPGVPPGDDTHTQDAAVKQLTDGVWVHYEAAVAAYATALAHLTKAVAQQKAAEEIVAALYNTACGASNTRGPGNDSIKKVWAASKAKVDQFANSADVAAAKASLDLAEDRLSMIDPGLAAFKAAPGAGFKSYRDRPEVQEFLTKLDEQRNAKASEVRRQRSEALVPLLAKQETVLALSTAIDKGLAAKDWEQSVAVDDNADRVVLTIRAKGKESIASVKGSTIEDRVSIVVKRANRFVLSGGFLLSALDQHDYQRTNLISATDPETTYSTFLDRRDDSGHAFAPTVMGSIIVAESRTVGLHVTTGVAARSVNNRVSPDFLVGIGPSFGDKFFLTLAYHVGRVERLLLGSGSAIAAQAVPEAVTREDAVGERWQDAVAISLSYRVN